MNTINELKQLIENPKALIEFISDYTDGYSAAVGLRGLYAEETLGDLEPSFVWDDGDQTDELMDGTSTIMIDGDWCYNPESVAAENIRRFAKMVFQYGDGRVGLVTGDDGHGGDDIGELVIKNAKLVYIWE